MASTYWIKLYHEILHDRKMAQLSDHLYRRVIELFLLAGETDQDGALPDVADMAWTLRTDETAMLDDLRAIAKVGIVTDTGKGWVVTNFAERQAPIDPDERVRRHRERKVKDAYYTQTKPENDIPNDVPNDAPPEPDNAPVTEPVTIEPTACNDVVTNRYSNVTDAVTIPSQIRIDKIRLDTDKKRKDSEPARASTPEREAVSAPAELRQPLQAFSFSEPDIGSAPSEQPEQPETSKPPDIREQCVQAIEYWRDIGKLRSVHSTDKDNITSLVKHYGFEQVKAAMDAERGRAIWHLQSRLMGKPIPRVESATVPA